MLDPQLLDILIIQSRIIKVSNHGSIPITIDCNVVAFIVFEEGFHQPIKRTKHYTRAIGEGPRNFENGQVTRMTLNWHYPLLNSTPHQWEDVIKGGWGTMKIKIGYQVANIESLRSTAPKTPNFGGLWMSKCLSTLHSKETRRLLVMNLVDLSLSQVKGPTPELAHSFPNSLITPTGGREPQQI
ncbi:hypothetical protein TNCV_2812081 [Trichonephila clavipes]|nr:hypothetical protein TNCV_2812081 [Trichonephila clavipes]